MTRNDRGQVVYVDPAPGTMVDLTPVAFELYAIAEAIRLDGLPCPSYSKKAQELYWEALDASRGPDCEDEKGVWPAPERIASVFEIAAEMADWLGI